MKLKTRKVKNKFTSKTKNKETNIPCENCGTPLTQIELLNDIYCLPCLEERNLNPII